MSDAQPCPHCGDTYDDAKSMDGSARRPRDGDYGLCVECLGVYVYELGALGILFRRVVNEKERAELARRPGMVAELQQAKEHVIRKKREKLTRREEDELKAARTEEEWGAACDKIKAARDGAYPAEWFLKIIASGFMATQQKKWRARV